MKTRGIFSRGSRCSGVTSQCMSNHTNCTMVVVKHILFLEQYFSNCFLKDGRSRFIEAAVKGVTVYQNRIEGGHDSERVESHWSGPFVASFCKDKIILL